MAEESVDDQLREMAEHRGFKLIRSRRRKAGVGDFGKFGLTNAVGKPLLGIGSEGLTATPDDIREYLRTGAVSTWKQSADITPDPRMTDPRPAAQDETQVDSAIRPRRKLAGDPTASRRSGHAPASRNQSTVRMRASRTGEAEAASDVSSRPVSAARAERLLTIRPGKPGDDEQIAALIAQLDGMEANRKEVIANLGAVRRSGGGMIVADLGDLVGCCCWTTIQSAQRGKLGRLTLLLVHEKYRRQQIGTQLLAAAEQKLKTKGCNVVEVLSDIEIKNAHNFFRTLDFEQTSYRFVRPIADGTN